MRKFLKALAVTLMVASFAVLPAIVTSQGFDLYGLLVQPFRSTPVSDGIFAADSSVMMYIRYTGSGVPEVTLATSTLTFTVDAVAYDGFECPVVAPLGGAIDVTNAACNTVGEIIDIINADVHGDFIAVAAAALRTDIATAAILPDGADVDVSTPNGEIVYWDSSTLDDETMVLVDRNYGGRTWWGNLPQHQIRLKNNPFANSESVLLDGWEQFTNAGNLTDSTVYCVVENYNTTGSSEEVFTIYYEAAAATTVLGTLAEIREHGRRCEGGKILWRVAGDSADMSAWNFGMYGYRRPTQ